MNVTVIPDPVKTNPIPQTPYVATYVNATRKIYVLVTRHAIGGGGSSGYMISTNDAYPYPLSYYSDGWVTAALEPFHGKIEITCP